MTSTVYIAKNVYGGDGLGRLGDGRVVFVPGAWEGEQVKAEIFEEKPRFVRARLVEVVEPSPERVDVGATVPGMVYAGLSAAALDVDPVRRIQHEHWIFPLGSSPGCPCGRNGRQSMVPVRRRISIFAGHVFFLRAAMPAVPFHFGYVFSKALISDLFSVTILPCSTAEIDIRRR